VGATPAHADRNDLTLERIIGMPATPGTFNDPTDPVRQTMYKSLMSELSLVMAPHALAPADTLGYSGFQLAFETSFTQISNNADFWQRGVENVSSSFLSTISVMARKGIWLPLPGFEIGAGATKLIDSNMYAVQAYAKLALHEGFHDWAIPSLAVRGAVSHLLGAPQVDLTVLSLDASLSKSFGIAGTVTLDPYLGAGALLSFVRGQVIDTTPNVDAFAQGPDSADVNANTTFPDPDTIVRWRLYAGFRLVYAFFALTGEFAYTFCNDSAGNCGKSDPTRVTDRSGGQAQINFSGSFLF
jgi:hypothetical protein